MSILASIGNTPLLSFERLRSRNKNVEIYAKAEWFNPGGSVKDRAALNMIREGEKTGQLTRDKIILDSTSGNTGIAYAMIGAVLGYKVCLVLPENANIERKKILASYGADIIYSSPFEGSDGAQVLAKKIYQENPDIYFLPGQYDNEANWQAHYNTTGPEIIRQTGGRVTHFIAGVGTSGTVMGTGRYLKEQNSRIKVYGLEPDSPMHGLEGLKHIATSIVPGIYDRKVLDDSIFVSTEAAYEWEHRLAKEEGLLVGHSGGAAMCGAMELADKLDKGVIVTVFPDSGDRYLSTVMWEQPKSNHSYSI
ncbi:MAG: PLP-dependent cysteine synthase family protein [bacterium]